MSNDSTKPESGGASRSERKRARTRAELLAAARKVFAQRGYHDTSIADITERADVGVGTFYLHFRDKDDMFNTLLDEGFYDLRAGIAADLRAGDGRSLTRLVMAVFRQAYLRRDLFQIAMTARGQGARVRRAEFDLADGLLQVLETVEEDALLAGYDLPVLAHLIAGMITQGIYLWFESDAPGPETMAWQMLLLLRHGLPAQLFAEDGTATEEETT
jgi:AcrR family transcriptional regulator